MIGSMEKRDFDPERNYNTFYEHHKFEPMREPLCYEADTVIPRVGWALDTAIQTKANNCLDLCCLDGFACLTLSDKLGIECVGVDLSRPGIELAKDRAAKRELPCRFQAMDVEDYQSPVKFDLILLFEAIEHFKQPANILGVIRHQLAPGGSVLISTPDAEGQFGITNVEDTCHLNVFTHRNDVTDIPGELLTQAIKPTISLPEYLRDHGFTVLENEVWNQLIHIRATI